MLFSKDHSDEKGFTDKLNIDDDLSKLFYYIHQSMYCLNKAPAL